MPTYANTGHGTSGLVNYWRLGEADHVGRLVHRHGRGDAAEPQRRDRRDLDQAPDVDRPTPCSPTQGRVRKSGSDRGRPVLHLGGPGERGLHGGGRHLRRRRHTGDQRHGRRGRPARHRAGAAPSTSPATSRPTMPGSCYRVVNGTWTLLGSARQTLTSGTTYRLALDMTGTTIRVLVNGTQVISVDRRQHHRRRRGGLALGFHGSATPTVTDTDRHAPGQLPDQPAHGGREGHQPRRLPRRRGDWARPAPSPATPTPPRSFDGVNDYGTVSRQISGRLLDRVLVQVRPRASGTAHQWWEGVPGSSTPRSAARNSDFGVSLRSDGRIVAGVGNTSDSRS